MSFSQNINAQQSPEITVLCVLFVINLFLKKLTACVLLLCLDYLIFFGLKRVNSILKELPEIVLSYINFLLELDKSDVVSLIATITAPWWIPPVIIISE